MTRIKLIGAILMLCIYYGSMAQKSDKLIGDYIIYSVKEEILWTTILVANNCPLWNPNMTSMDVAPNGLAGFVYREGNVSARYVEESSLGVLKTPVEISTNLQGFISNIQFGSDNEPRVSLSYDVNDYGGVTYVQRTNGAWLSPIMVITNIFYERRHAMTLVDDKPSILWYEDYQSGGYFGKLCEGNAAGDTFTCVEVDVPPFPNYPGDLRRPFALATGSDGKRHIALNGPGFSVCGAPAASGAPRPSGAFF